MDDMESLPKDFVKKSEIVPIGNHGISSLDEFQSSEEHIHHVEWLKSIGLSQEEISLYEDHKAGVLSRQIQSEVLQSRLDSIFKKISDNTNEATGSNNNDVPSTSTKNTDKPIENLQDKSTKFYPEGHPMHSIHELEKDMFGHLQDDNILPLNKRRKMLRHLERRKERVQDKKLLFDRPDVKSPKPGSLWDVKDPCQMPKTSSDTEVKRDAMGPKKPTMYTVKDNKIVRLEPLAQEDKDDEYRVMDIVIPVNEAEERLLEGTKMRLDDIKKIERFKDYEPGIPSKTLYLKNIAASVSKDQLSVVFNQFVQDNGGPIDVRLMSSTGAMRGQAFVAFQNEDTSIRALDEVNGTILAGQPIIAQFGRHSNRIQDG